MRWLWLIFALCFTGAAYGQSQPPWPNSLSALSVYPLGAPPQITGYATTNVPEAETLTGDGGDCPTASLTRTAVGAYGLTLGCTVPITHLTGSSGVAAGSYTTASITVNAQGLVTSASNGAGAGIYPAGAPPQLAGYSATNTPEAETVTGAITLSRSGANAYTATTPHTACSGQWINDISTAAVGTCSSSVTAPLTPPQTATYSAATATFNAALGSEAKLTISHNVTITLSGCVAGQHLFLKLAYTGSFTPTFAVAGSDTLNFNANGAPAFTAANNKTDIIGFDCQSNGTGIDYDALPASLGYAA